MSFTARHRFPVGDSDRHMPRSTGLRSRQSSSPAVPPVRLSPTNTGSAQAEPTKIRSITDDLSITSPLTPTTSSTQNKKKSWVDSASKSLGLKSLRRKESLIPGRTMTNNSVGPSRTQSVRKLTVPLPHNLAGSSRSPVPAPLSHQQQQSPPVPASANHLHHPSPPQKDEKPLPSLPVATVKYQSPVRRSLIDCIEKPLRRRSMTPPDGSPEEEEEDWPTIEPTKSDLNLPSPETQPQIKPSLSESLYEGMRALNLKDSKANSAKAKTNSEVDSLVAAASSPVNGDAIETVAEELLSDGRSRPISSSQLPKPRDSMLQSLSRHIDSPVVRHTKASTLRLQQVTGKSNWDPNEKQKFANSHIPTIPERAESPSHTKTKQEFHVGPVRNHSRGRHGVTTRGSAYTIPSRALPSRKPVPRNEAKEKPSPAYNPRSSQILEDSRNEAVTNPLTSPTRTLRKSSLPLLARYAQEVASSEEQIHSQHAYAGPFINPPTQKPKGVNGPTGHVTELSQASECAEKPTAAREASPFGQSDEVLSVKQVLSTAGPDEAESFVDSNEEISAVGVRGYDAFGGYRIRRVGNNDSKMGPTLRITDSASRVLLGAHGERDTLNSGSPVNLRHKGSAPDIGSPRMTKDQVRRSSAVYTSFPLPSSGAENIANRSANPYQNANQVDTRSFTDSSSSADTVIRAELPGSEPSVGIESTADRRSDADSAQSTPPRRSSTLGTPKSDHGDWPGKHFADFNTGIDTTPTGPKKDATSAEALTEPDFRRPAHSKSPSRPPTIVEREAPSKETAPFLFQDVKEEYGGREKLANDLAISAGSSSESSVDGIHATSTPSMTSAKTSFPPRTSSRKPKPPPIYVSPPTVSFVSAQAAPKAFAVRAESIKKPRNVKTFSQSVSPRIDSNKGRKISGILSSTPSTSSKKKVVSSIRGLFHKKSFDSNKPAIAGMHGEIEPLPVIPALVHDYDRPSRGSFRRKQLPTFTIADNDKGARKFFNPLHPPGSTDTGMRTLKHKNPLASPTTPWTANLKTPYPPSAYSTIAGGANASSKSPRNQPFPHAHPSTSLYSPSILSPRTPHSTPSATSTSDLTLSTATTLTHTLLDLARQEPHPAKKSHLIELSKCMVEVVSSARDAEKAMEKAKMEASRAEVSLLKCLKEVQGVEGLVRRIFEGNKEFEDESGKDMGLGMEGPGRGRTREV